MTAAQRLADEFFAAAEQVEAAGRVPRAQLDRLADHGLYALTGPTELGGVAPREVWGLAETLASGCLATAFVWIQHLSALRAVTASDRPGIRAAYLEPMCRGQVRAGLALGGLRPGPPCLRVRTVPGGVELTGEAPWVTGWGLVDVLHVAARDEDDMIVWVLLDAVEAPNLRVEPLSLAAVNASRTVTLRVDRLVVPADQVTGTLPFAAWPERDAAGLRLNGSLALGLAGRCRRLLTDAELAGGLGREVDAARTALDTAGPDELPVARAGAAELALRSAATLLTAVGASGTLAGATAQRLMREAAFLLVFGSRPGIRAELLRRISPATPRTSWDWGNPEATSH